MAQSAPGCGGHIFDNSLPPAPGPGANRPALRAAGDMTVMDVGRRESEDGWRSGPGDRR